jgi:hypothetical protein
MFWLGLALGSSKGGRRAAEDIGDAIAPIFIILILIAIIAAVLALPITMIVGAAKLIADGWTETVSNLVFAGAFAVVPGLFFGWVAAWAWIPEIIAPTPCDGLSRWSRRDENYDEKMRKHRKVALIAAPIALAVGFLIALMGHFIVTGIMGGSFVMAGILLIIAAVISIPMSALTVLILMR